MLHEHRAQVLARDVVRAGNEMWVNGQVPPGERRIKKEIWDRAEVRRILDICKDHDKSITAVRGGVPVGHEALSELARIPAAGYSADRSSGVPSAQRSKGEVVRGDIVPASVECIDLPEALQECSLKLSDLEGLSKELPLGHASDLLLPFCEADLSVGYADPALRRGNRLDELATSLVMCGLCVPTQRLVPIGIKLFCVAKNGDVGAPKSQRLIWDCRPVSAMLKHRWTT